MIYNPSAGISPLFLELRNFFLQGLAQAGISAAADFANRTPREWQYYAGVLAGATVAAAGTPGASLAVYAAAEALDLLVFKSPEGEGFDVFVDGVASGSVVTYAIDAAWEAVRVNLGGTGTQKVEFRSRDEGSGTNWFAVASVVPFNGSLQARENFEEALPWQVTISLKDSRGRKASTSFYYPYFAEFSDVERFTREFVRRMERCIDGSVEQATVSRRADIDPVEIDGSASVHSKANFALAATQRVLTRISIPTWSESLVAKLRYAKPPMTPDANNADVQSFKAMLNNAVLEGFLSNPCDARGNIVSIIHRATRYSVRA